MIIGIAGRIGSGKDTVGKIIQYLTTHPKSNGKTDGGSINRSYGSHLIDIGCGYEPDWKIKKFAGKLKQIASLLTGIPVEDFEDQEFKKSYLGAEWGTVESNPLNAVPVFENIEFNHLMSVRELLQKLGTEAIRDGLHPNAWVNALMCDYKRPKMSEYNPSNWIITDVRFPNELAAVNDVNGLTIRVVRTTFRTTETEFGKVSLIVQPEVDKSLGIQEHPSETALDSAKFDYEIINDGSIEDLIEKVRQILITEKII
jgi:hypothetical protein